MSAQFPIEILPALARLNSWCRLPYEQKNGMSRLESVIYGWKRSAIHAAIKGGIAKLRLVSVERPCKPCKGTGTYEWHDWDDENYIDYQDCRRCGATGRVTLRFVESSIEGFRWHTPRPKWDLGIFEPADWESCEPAGDWEPEQPGQSLSLIELVESLNAVERIILPPLVPWESWPSPDSKLPAYALHLGKIRSCPICGRETAAGLSEKYGPVHEIYRPAIRWTQDCCWRDGHDCMFTGLAKPLQWPYNLLPPRCDFNDPDRWEYHAPLPEIAYHPAITEWLGRRGIVIGAWPPDECAWTPNGTMVKVAAIRGTEALVRIYDSHDWLWGGYDDRLLIPLPAASLRRRQRGGPWAEAVPVDYPEVLA